VRRRRIEERTAGHERWLVSYADFITLLFAFFTTLYAISTVDLQKMHHLVSSLQVAFDTKGLQGAVHQAGMTSDPSMSVKTDALRSGANSPTLPGIDQLPKLPPKVLAELGRGYLEATLNDVRQRLGETLKPAVLDGRVSMNIDRRGLVVSIRESGTFKIGSADISDGMRPIVGEVGAALRGVDNLVRVEGHTDDIPIHTARFASNWELSTARATAVVACLVQDFGLAPDRLSAAGYAEFHPRVPNSDGASRATNRRVDIVILNQTTSQAEEPGPPGERR
jgi:chemotaxis protein MotB